MKYIYLLNKRLKYDKLKQNVTKIFYNENDLTKM